MNLSDAITDQSIAIRCTSKEAAELLLNAYEEIGLDVPSIDTWDENQSLTCYRRSATLVHFCNRGYYTSLGYVIIDFDGLTRNLVSLSDYLY